MAKQVKVTLNLTGINTFLLIVLLGILLVSLYSVMQVQTAVKDLKPPTPPTLAKLAVTIIAPADCEDCFDASAFTDAVRQAPLTNVTENTVFFDSIEGQKLISRYKLTRLPAAVVTGETENVTIQGFTKTDDAYVFANTPPPYYDLSKGGVVGRVSLTFITDSGCAQCLDITQFGSQLEQVGVKISSKSTADAGSSEGKALISRYAITKVPTMLLSEDALAYDVIKQVWPTVGSQEADGMLVFRNVTPPYKDLGTNKVRGLVTITYLTDKSCVECYNVTMHKLVLEQSFGTKFKGEKTADIGTLEGERLAAKYRITKVPTTLLDAEAAVYSALVQAWPQVGSTHPDGTFVFEKIDLLQGVTYKDLSDNTVKNATAQQ